MTKCFTIQESWLLLFYCQLFSLLSAAIHQTWFSIFCVNRPVIASPFINIDKHQVGLHEADDHSSLHYLQMNKVTSCKNIIFIKNP